MVQKMSPSIQLVELYSVKTHLCICTSIQSTFIRVICNELEGSPLLTLPPLSSLCRN